MRPKGTSLSTLVQSESPVGSSGVDDTITSVDDLAALPSLGLAFGTIKIFVDANTQAQRTFQLRDSDEATADGVQRANDFDPVTNRKVWFEC